MPGPHKGISTQCTTQQQHTKPRHQPSDRDQQARDRLRNKISKSKAKIKSRACLQLGEKTLQTVHQTFEPNIPVILHLPALTNTTVDTDTILMLYVIQESRHCMPTTDYYFTNIQPEPIIVPPPHRRNTFDITQMCLLYIKINASSWRKAADLIAQGTQANQQVQAAATADSS